MKQFLVMVELEAKLWKELVVKTNIAFSYYGAANGCKLFKALPQL